MMCLMASSVWYTNPCLLVLVPEVVWDVVLYAVQHFDIGNLFPIFYVVVDDNLIVEQIDGVYENVDDAAAEIHALVPAHFRNEQRKEHTHGEIRNGRNHTGQHMKASDKDHHDHGHDKRNGHR